MQLTNWHKFDEIVGKIEDFRFRKAENTGNYRVFKRTYLNRELETLFAQRIAEGKTKTRESDDASLGKFLKTQSSNMRDYADASFRYLRATGLVNVSHVGKSLSIIPEKIKDVDFILANVDRNPVFINDSQQYVNYLGNAQTPQLLTDNKTLLLKRLHTEFPNAHIDSRWEIERLKDVFADCIEERKSNTICEEVAKIKDYRLYDDIQQVFRQITSNELYDAALMLEWNTWRAMTMLDGGDIKANLNFDDYGKPLSTAQGNMPDIVCNYGNFYLSVEVTLSSGQRQYEMENESVSRHLGKLKKATGKPCYCLFIAPTINEACIAHFFGLHNMNISYYGGKSIIVPLPLKIFQQMLENSYKADNIPQPSQVEAFFAFSRQLADGKGDEQSWYKQMKQAALTWPSK